MNRTIWLVIAMLVLSAVLRLYRLAEIPEGFHADEAAFGYNAYSLLKTGKDEYGKPFPLYLHSFGDDKGAMYAYAVIPFILMNGLTEWAVRAPSAIFGTLLVLLVFLLANRITKRKDIALVACGLAALSPVGVVLSRVQSDPLMGVFFTYLGLYFMWIWSEKKSWCWIIAIALSWLIAIYSYYIPRTFLILFLPAVFIYFRKTLLLSQKVWLVVLYGVLCILILQTYLVGGSRLGQVTMFGRANVSLPVEERIREDGISFVPSVIARVFHNKIFENARFFINSYAQYFGYDFLFREANQPQRERIPDMGVLYFIEIPFILLGIYWIFRTKKSWGFFLLYWLFIGTISFAFAIDETPNIHRFFIVIFPFYLLTAIGIVSSVAHFYSVRYRMLIGGVIVMVFVVNTTYFLHQLFIHQPANKPYYRGYAYKELMEKIKKSGDTYKTIVMTKFNSSPYIYVLFYTAFDPATYQAMGSPRDLAFSGFDRYRFAPEDCPTESGQYNDLHDSWSGRTVFINRGGCRKDVSQSNIVRWRDGHEAFQLFEFIPTGADHQ